MYLKEDMKHPKSNFSSLLIQLKDMQKNGKVFLIDFAENFEDKGRFVVCLFISLLFITPIQIPGFSTPFGLAISFLMLRNFFHKKIPTPKFFQKISVSSKFLNPALDKGFRIFQKLEKLLRKRLLTLTSGYGKSMLNLSLIFSGFVLALPLPIFLSNMLVAWSIILVSLGAIEEDGLLVIIGYFLQIFYILYLSSPFWIIKLI